MHSQISQKTTKPYFLSAPIPLLIARVYRINLKVAKICKILIPHTKPVLGLAVSTKHNLIATGGNGGVIRVWNIKDWSPIGETRTILGPVWALAFTGDGKSLYYGSLDDEVKHWKISKDEDENLWKSHKPRRFQVKTGMKLGELQFARKCSVCHTLKAGDANRAGLHYIIFLEEKQVHLKAMFILKSSRNQM